MPSFALFDASYLQRARGAPRANNAIGGSSRETRSERRVHSNAEEVDGASLQEISPLATLGRNDTFEREEEARRYATQPRAVEVSGFAPGYAETNRWPLSGNAS